MNTLAGRVIAVTGASRGIGRAIVQALAGQGAQVLAGARALPAEAGPGVATMPLDVTSPASVQAFAERAAGLGADSLVNNAGVGSFALIEDSTPEEFHRIFNTNVLGTLLLCQAFVPLFRRRHAQGSPGSRVVNVTSDVSTRSFAHGALYTGSKFAQRAVTQALAYEGQSFGLSVTEVRPGMTDTFFNGATQGRPEAAGHLQPADVAEAVRFALAAPWHARVDEVTLHPTRQGVVY